MTAFVIDFLAERNARIEEANRDDARRKLEAMAGWAVNHMLAGLPGASEAQAILENAFAERLPEEMTEESILRQMEEHHNVG